MADEPTDPFGDHKRHDDPAQAGSVLTLRVAAMRALLNSLGPCSDREALALLREAFPDLPLAERIEAFGRWRG